MGGVGTPSAGGRNVIMMGLFSDYNVPITYTEWTMYGWALVPTGGLLVFLYMAVLFGRKIKNDNPWDATTLEWATPTPPPHGNFTFDVGAYRGPYEYSRPDHEGDFFPQWEEPKRDQPADDSGQNPGEKPVA